MEEKNIKFDMPETIDQIEAVGSLYKSIFNLGAAYGCEKPGLLIDKLKWTLEYELTNHIKKQNNEIEARAAEEAKLKESEAEITDQPEPEIEDEPIDLSKINF